MAAPAKPKNQHTVPQFLLRGFRSHRKDQIHVFDKRTGKSFRTAIRNVTSETGFYDYVQDGKALSIEHDLAKLEADVSRLVKRIRNNATLAFLSEDERVRLAIFTGIQILRVRKMRDMMDEMDRHLRKMIVTSGGDPEQCPQILGPEDHRAASVRIIRIARELVPHILDKAWFLMRSPKDYHFYTSDNPVVLQQSVVSGDGTLGLAHPGIEVYLPLSTDLVLCFLCPRLAAKIQLAAPLARALLFGTVSSIAAAIETGMPMAIARENVDNVNSLQVLHATRFVLSSNEDFTLAKAMIDKDPTLKYRRSFAIA